MERISLLQKANDIRKTTLTMCYHAHTGHIGGSLSSIDYLTALFYKIMNYDVSNPTWKERDRFILSKGHNIEGYISILADLGFIEKSELDTFCQFGSRLIGHPDINVPGVEMNTGSLGHGIGGACGMALGGQKANASFRVYCLLGDGELAEGSVWEAFMFASNYNLSNLYVAIDRNRLQISGPTENVMRLEPLEQKVKSFGFATEVIDGNNIPQILTAFERLEQVNDKPKMIILNTIKGKGISFMENNPKWHHGHINDEQYALAVSDLDNIGRYL